MAGGSLSLFLLAVGILAVRSPEADASAEVCLPRGPVDGLARQCPSWIEMSSPLEVTEETLGTMLGPSRPRNSYSILFYSSWCPFSHNFRPTFDALNSMFPQITHLVIEQSSAMPSVFSRYGIRSFPSIMLADKKTRKVYHGPKELASLVKFYKEATGYDPVTCIVLKESSNSDDGRYLWERKSSLKERMASDPYLFSALLFVFLKALFIIIRMTLSYLNVFCVLLRGCASLGIFGQSRLLLDRALHLIDVKKLRSKTKFWSRASNLQKGANNARVWATSLASVSLGESSSAS